jgi:hypothetical protein
VSNPANVDLAAGVYVLPGTTYLLVVDGPGSHLRLPATGPPSLLDLVTPPSPPSQPQPTLPTAPATSTSGTPTWLVILAGLLVGGIVYLMYERWSSPVPAPAPVPAPVPVVPPAPGPAPAPTPTPKPAPGRPDWLPSAEQDARTQSDAIAQLAIAVQELRASVQSQGKPGPLEWRTLDSDPRFQGYGRDVEGHFLIETWRPLVQPAPLQEPPATLPAPLIYRPLVCPPGASQ